jgi:4-hydroxy-tetrahydrodipicolinate synthase
MPAVSGVIAAAVTPRRDAPEIDLGATFELIDLLGRAGVDAIALMSAAGEFPHFQSEERNRLVVLAVKRSRVPILAGASHSTLDGAVALAREAADAGVAGVLLMPPHFFPYPQEDVREFFLRFAERFKDAAPVWLENAPRFTSPIATATAIDLLNTGQFAGIVEGGDGLEHLAEARRAVPFGLLAGNDGLAARGRRAGADGVLSAAASAIPELVVAAQRSPELDQLLQEFVCRTLELAPPVAVRRAATLRGVKAGGPATPSGPEGARKLAQFDEWFRGWWPSIQKEISHA